MLHRLRAPAGMLRIEHVTVTNFSRNIHCVCCIIDNMFIFSGHEMVVQGVVSNVSVIVLWKVDSL
jgi:hypothetical protein